MGDGKGPKIWIGKLASLDNGDTLTTGLSTVDAVIATILRSDPNAAGNNDQVEIRSVTAGAVVFNSVRCVLTQATDGLRVYASTTTTPYVMVVGNCQ